MSDRSIVFVVNALTHGGAEIQVSRLARGLARRGWKVAVVSMIRPEALVPELEAAGVAVHCLDMTPGVPNPLAILRLRRILNRFRPQIVHSHIAHANILSRVTRMITSVPVLVCTAHNTNEGGRMLMLAYRYTDWLADVTTNVSVAGVRRQVEMRSARPDRVQFMPNGLDLDHFRPDPALRAEARRGLNVGDKFVWLAVGRMEEAKDYPNLLNAFAALSARRPDAHLLIAGQGKLDGELRALAGGLGLADRVRFLGVRGDVAAVMNAADAYVMSSRWEGMPLVLQEAAAVGLVIVATDVGGNAEVVRHGESGHLIPAGDSQALATAMFDVMGLSPERRHEMGQLGRSYVESRFGMEQVLTHWETLYRGILEKRRVAQCA